VPAALRLLSGSASTLIKMGCGLSAGRDRSRRDSSSRIRDAWLRSRVGSPSLRSEKGSAGSTRDHRAIDRISNRFERPRFRAIASSGGIADRPARCKYRIFFQWARAHFFLFLSFFPPPLSWRSFIVISCVFWQPPPINSLSLPPWASIRPSGDGRPRRN